MCLNITSINNLCLVSKYTPIILPDNSIKAVTHTSSIVLNPRLILKNVLHVPKFTCNLLSVKSLAESAKIIFKFYSTHCVLQDLETEKLLAYGRIIGNLYILDNHSLFSISYVSHRYPCNPSKPTHLCNVVQTCNKDSFLCGITD